MLGEKEEVRDGASGCKKTEYSIYVGGGVCFGYSRVMTRLICVVSMSSK